MRFSKKQTSLLYPGAGVLTLAGFLATVVARRYLMRRKEFRKPTEETLEDIAPGESIIGYLVSRNTKGF